MLSARVLDEVGFVISIHDRGVPGGHALPGVVQLAIRTTAHVICFRVDTFLEGIPGRVEQGPVGIQFEWRRTRLVSLLNLELIPLAAPVGGTVSGVLLHPSAR